MREPEAPQWAEQAAEAKAETRRLGFGKTARGPGSGEYLAALRPHLQDVRASLASSVGVPSRSNDTCLEQVLRYVAENRPADPALAAADRLAELAAGGDEEARDAVADLPAAEGEEQVESPDGMARTTSARSEVHTWSQAAEEPARSAEAEQKGQTEGKVDSLGALSLQIGRARATSTLVVATNLQSAPQPEPEPEPELEPEPDPESSEPEESPAAPQTPTPRDGAGEPAEEEEEEDEEDEDEIVE